MKKLVLKITKFDKAIEIHVKELIGMFRDSEHVKFSSIYKMDSFNNEIVLSAYNTYSKHFNSNQERDEYVNTAVHWITKEQFKSNIKINIGDYCYASNDAKEWHKTIYIGKLPEQIEGIQRIITTNSVPPYKLDCVRYTKPIKNPQIENDTYMWKI